MARGKVKGVEERKMIWSSLLNGKSTCGPLSHATAIAVALIKAGVPRERAILAAGHEVPNVHKLPPGLLSRSIDHYLK